MGRYVNETLIKDEEILYEANISLWSQTPIILFGFIFLFAYGIGLVFWLIAFIRYKTTELAITNKRVIAKFGFISRNTVEMSLSKVESIQVHQGILGRIFNFGSLTISGAGNPQAPIQGVVNPMQFRRRVMEAQDQAGR